MHTCANAGRAKSHQEIGSTATFLQETFHNSLNSEVLFIIREDQTPDFSYKDSFERVKMTVLELCSTLNLSILYLYLHCNDRKELLLF